jgi:hypothetical protein
MVADPQLSPGQHVVYRKVSHGTHADQQRLFIRTERR